MIILGIDPGLATVGFGLIDASAAEPKLLECGVVKTGPKLPFPERLLEIKNDIEALITQFRPAAVGVESLFFARNVTTAIKVSHARGVIVERVAHHQLPFFEFTPLEIKNNICGYGQADKAQMQIMVQRLLNLNLPPKPDDAADALGIAICTARAFKIEELR